MAKHSTSLSHQVQLRDDSPARAPQVYYNKRSETLPISIPKTSCPLFKIVGSLRSVGNSTCFSCQEGLHNWTGKRRLQSRCLRSQGRKELDYSLLGGSAPLKVCPSSPTLTIHGVNTKYPQFPFRVAWSLTLSSHLPGCWYCTNRPRSW